jgi:hypothetical protein
VKRDFLKKKIKQKMRSGNTVRSWESNQTKIIISISYTKHTTHKDVAQPTMYKNREYCAYNIGNVCECSFPFSIAIACSYKEQASSRFPCNKREKIEWKKERKKKLTYLWEIGTLNSVLCPTYQPMFHISMLNNCFNKTRWDFSIY